MADCKECDGTGDVCANCGDVEDACECVDGWEHASCEACEGSGQRDDEDDDDE